MSTKYLYPKQRNSQKHKIIDESYTQYKSNVKHFIPVCHNFNIACTLQNICFEYQVMKPEQ